MQQQRIPYAINMHSRCIQNATQALGRLIGLSAYLFLVPRCDLLIIFAYQLICLSGLFRASLGFCKYVCLFAYQFIGSFRFLAAICIVYNLIGLYVYRFFCCNRCDFIIILACRLISLSALTCPTATNSTLGPNIKKNNRHLINL